MDKVITRTVISVSITESDKNKLKELAKREEKTVSGLIHEMISYYDKKQRKNTLR